MDKIPKVFKVTAEEFLENSYTPPLQYKIDEICELIEESGLYYFNGESRIDGTRIYILKDNVIRKGKLDIVTGKGRALFNKLDELISIIEPNIQYINILNGDTII